MHQDDPNYLMRREAGANAETMNTNLAKEREYDRIYSQLREQFSIIDQNNDGGISMDEIVRFLNE